MYNITSICTAIVLLAMTAGATYSCATNNTKYYEMAHNCIESGGSFIPIHDGNGGDAICITFKQK